MAGQGSFAEFLLSAYCTDDYGGTVYPMRIWLNGTEVVSGGIEAVSGEGNVVKYFDLTPFLDLVHAGTNTIAVMLNNTWQSDWDNVAFDLRLQAIPAAVPETDPKAEFTSVVHEQNGTVSLTIDADAASAWSLQVCNAAKPLSWQTLKTVTFSAGGSQTIRTTQPTKRFVCIACFANNQSNEIRGKNLSRSCALMIQKKSRIRQRRLKSPASSPASAAFTAEAILNLSRG